MKGISAALCNTSHHLSRGGSPTRTLKTLLLAVACPTSPASHINLTPAKLRHQCPSSPTPTGRPRLWNVREFFSGVIHGHHEGTRGAVPTTSSTAAAATPARVTTRQGRAPAAPARPRREPGERTQRGPEFLSASEPTRGSVRRHAAGTPHCHAPGARQSSRDTGWRAQGLHTRRAPRGPPAPHWRERTPTSGRRGGAERPFNCTKRHCGPRKS